MSCSHRFQPAAVFLSNLRSLFIGAILCSGLSLFGQTEDPIIGQAGASIEIEAAALFDLPPVVAIETSQGTIPVELTPDEAPATVTNFLRYADAGLYENSFIHRSAVLQDGSPFIIQGGGHFFDSSGESTVVAEVPAFDPVVNEPNVSNVRGTIAMAKKGGDPDSATSQWFFNLSDNGPILDDQNGGFTVFGRVVGEGMDVVDAIAALTRYNLTEQLNAIFDEVPLTESVLDVSSFVTLSAVERLSPQVLQAAFPDGGASFFTLSYIEGVITVTVSPETDPGEYRMQVEGATLGGTSQVLERMLQISPPPTAPWYDSAADLGEGWRWFDWFKSFRPVQGGWIYHELHSWLYVSGEDPDGLFLWDDALNRWLWTSETVYPWLYAFGSGGGWVFFFENGRPGERAFARGGSGEVLFEQQLLLSP